MMHTKIPHNHVTFQTANELREVCKEFFSVAKVDGFYYGELLPDKISMLTMHPECNRAIFEAGLAPNLEKMQQGLVYLPTSQDKQRAEFNQWFQIFHQLEFSIRHNYGFKVFGFFCYDDQPDMINHYLNNLEKFTQFIGNFAQEAKTLIDCARKNPILTPSLTAAKPQDISFPSKVKVSVTPSNSVSLSRRELELMRYLCKGHSMKEIALLMHLSVRTVESYLNNIRNKTNLQKRSDLVAFYFKQKLPL